MLRRRSSSAGVTLVELLVALTVVSILTGVALGAYRSVDATRRRTAELHAGRQLIGAYMAAAADRDGEFLRGYDQTTNTITLPDGAVVSGPPAWRYPYRLAPYFNYQIKGLILLGDNIKKVVADSHYSVSCFPAFGMNTLFVGGEADSTGKLTNADECATSGANAGGSLLVFASACSRPEDAPAGSGPVNGSSNEKIAGYCKLEPPRLGGPIWSTAPWKATSAPKDFGHVDPRHGGKAVCAFLDGSVRLLAIDELRNMRLWSRGAVQADEPNYTIPDQGGGPRF